MTLPAVPDPFYWTELPVGCVLRCRPLDAIAPHCFTTRDVPLVSASDWDRLGQALGADTVVTVNQVHGRDVVTVRRVEVHDEGRRSGDVLVSDDPAVAIAVRAADCVPLLIADSQTGVVAAVHAGWRGTAAGAAPAAVESLRGAFGSQAGNLIAAIGPSIGPCCYEVGSELVDAFAAAGHPRHLVDRWFKVGDRGSGIGDRTKGTLYLDVAGANRDQLVLAGVPETQIYSCGLCTAMHLDVLTSYRVEKQQAGRIAGAIRARR